MERLNKSHTQYWLHFILAAKWILFQFLFQVPGTDQFLPSSQPKDDRNIRRRWLKGLVSAVQSPPQTFQLSLSLLNFKVFSKLRNKIRLSFQLLIWHLNGDTISSKIFNRSKLKICLKLKSNPSSVLRLR